MSKDDEIKRLKVIIIELKKLWMASITKFVEKDFDESNRLFDTFFGYSKHGINDNTTESI